MRREADNAIIFPCNLSPPHAGLRHLHIRRCDTHVDTSRCAPLHFPPPALLEHLRPELLASCDAAINRIHMAFVSPQPRDLDEGDFAEME